MSSKKLLIRYLIYSGFVRNNQLLIPGSFRWSLSFVNKCCWLVIDSPSKLTLDISCIPDERLLGRLERNLNGQWNTSRSPPSKHWCHWSMCVRIPWCSMVVELKKIVIFDWKFHNCMQGSGWFVKKTCSNTAFMVSKRSISQAGTRSARHYCWHSGTVSPVRRLVTANLCNESALIYTSPSS